MADGITRFIRRQSARAMGAALDSVFPQLCPLCERETAAADPGAAHGSQTTRGLCARCWPEVTFLTAPWCIQCGEPFSAHDSKVLGSDGFCLACLRDPPIYGQLRAALSYNDAARRLVIRFKHLNQPELAPLLARWMVRAGRDLIDSADIIVATPLHWRRRFARQYNQATLLAQAIARAVGRPEMLDAAGLKRLRRTLPMGRLSAVERKRNVRAAFAVPTGLQRHYRGKTVLLIDDVHASGATTTECIKALRRAGAKEVNVLVLARSLRNPTS